MQVIDFTKMRANKKRRLVRCPKCHKVGEIHRYKDGTASITHTGNLVNIAGIAMLSVTKSCMLRDEVKS